MILEELLNEVSNSQDVCILDVNDETLYEGENSIRLDELNGSTVDGIWTNGDCLCIAIVYDKEN